MIFLVTGGSGSGKSMFAEGLLEQKNNKVYIATMIPFGEETMSKIEKHKRLRQDKGFVTIEKYTGIKEMEIPHGCSVILECMSNLVANEIFSHSSTGDDVVSEIILGIDHISSLAETTVIVTNEIFSDDGKYEGESKRYISVLGYINRLLAEKSDCVVEVVYGIPIYIKRCGR